MIKKYKFDKKYKIKKNDDFEKLFQKGKRLFGKFYVMIFYKNEFCYPRLGICVSKKIGKAHKRNYEKRIVREFFRYNRESLGNYDIILIRNRKDGNFREKEKDFRKLIIKLEKTEQEENNHNL